ncbi:MAG TPA: DUF5683 domain-containing protein [Terriglobales bacterium]|nr:DUF5683 domain-containing protein [Terriglobales bacterium]
MTNLKEKRVVWLLEILYGLTLILFCSFSQTAFAQEEEKKPETGLEITSVPSGATVFLEGEYSLNATTPATLPLNLKGRYKIRAFKEGYEGWSTSIWLDGITPKLITITLSPKTRLKGALRSAIFPGWGQYYYGEKKKAFLFSFATLAAAAAFVVTDNDFSNKNDDYVSAKNDYNAATNVEDKYRLKQILDEKQRKAYDAENVRRATLILVGAAWGFNLLDAIVFFPSLKESLNISSTISIEPGKGGIRLSLVKNF